MKIKYSAALYMRLSKDDDKYTESSSIITQRKMLSSFAKENGFDIYDEYIDDGFSGTNFNRPAFRRMISDIELGNLNMVITKDFSRLGRDYITTGKYTEIFFPEHNIRYISINDDYDSFGSTGDTAPFKHVVNEMYARDTSKKIRSALYTKMKQGLFIGSFAPYGYKKSEYDKNKLEINDETAKTVREIFYYALNEKSPTEIANILNNRLVPTPIIYRMSQNPTYKYNKNNNTKWTASSVCKILNNTVYIGNMTQGKTKKVSFKSHLIKQTSVENQYTVENTHPAIIPKEVFDAIKSRCLPRKQNHKNKNVFSGTTKCKTCGKNMSSSGLDKDKNIKTLVCGKYKLYGKNGCSSHRINYNLLLNIIKNELQNHLTVSDNEKNEIIDFFNNNFHINKDIENSKKNIDNNKNRLNEIDRIIKKLYDDFGKGLLTENRLKYLLKEYEKENKHINSEIKQLCLNKDKINTENIEDLINKIFSLDVITRDVISDFISKIEIGDNILNEQKQKKQVINIYFKFKRNP